MSMEQQTLDPATFDWWGTLSSPEFLADPHPLLHELRAIGPILQNDLGAAYFALGHDAFTKVTRSKIMGNDTRLMNNSWYTPENREKDPLTYALFNAFQPQILNVNPPDHRRMRRTYEKFFTPSAVARMEPLIRAETQALLDEMPGMGEVDLMPTFARHLPFRIILGMFDVPMSEAENIARYSDTILRISEFLMTPEEKKRALDDLIEFKAWTRDFMAHRRRNADDRPIDAVIATGPPDGDLDDDELVTNFITMIISGHKTTVSLLGNGIHALLEHPDQFRRLRRNPDLMKTAIEETMRVEPGAYLIPRIANADFHYGGTTIPKGSVCIGLVAAINRDPAVFENPDHMDIARNPNPHMSFGGGIHHCLGAPLARLEARIAYEMLLDRYPVLERAEPTTWVPHCLNNHCPERLVLHVKGH
ncbi:Cytochrome P450 [Sulfidibacter corallicola]|uniref:Cytochrome P450 n=1 Tax=Sulfidibacter corallicola TaxID=2818388 RepID=A0A8A4TMX3_SULCO|nr:cytochrome P450 [Sulfidibacter corallicola]QTD50241.1 cytochrome P450 [Sulfidibacter corallicola]